MSDVEPPPTSEAPLALQIAVRVERTDPPTTTEAAIAAASATIALLDDERSGPSGEWHDAVARWNAARIRKIVRRARGSAWTRVQEVDGVTVDVDGVEARAFVPGPIDEVPRPVARLQIQSSPLALAERSSVLEPRPELPRPRLQVAVTPEVDMSWGKVAAQCAHAAQRAWMLADPALRQRWTESGRPMTLVHPDATLWVRLVELADVQIRDGGFTEIPAGTRTTVANWLIAADEPQDRER